MQHLTNQTEEVFTRKWNFDQKWNNVEHALLRENQQRSDDVELSKKNLQNKINSLNQLENNKVAVMNDNIKYLRSQADGLEKNTENTLKKGKDFQNQYEHRNIDFISDYLQDSQSFAAKILAYSKTKCNDVQKRMYMTDQNIKRKTDEEMKQLREGSINHIKQIMKVETQNQKTSLENLNNLVNDSIKNMRDSLKQYEKQCQRSEIKLEEEIQRLDRDMFSVIDKENKQGDMTYDCLLKLVQDSCSKIQEIRMRC